MINVYGYEADVSGRWGKEEGTYVHRIAVRDRSDGFAFLNTVPERFLRNLVCIIRRRSGPDARLLRARRAFSRARVRADGENSFFVPRRWRLLFVLLVAQHELFRPDATGLDRLDAIAAS